MTELCGRAYVRPEEFGGSTMTCQYIVGHRADRHSWFAIKAQDEADIEAAREMERSRMPTASEDDEDAMDLYVQEFLSAVTRGDLDSYLNAILTVGHTRKEVRRGQRGFRRGTTEVRLTSDTH